MNWRRRNYKSSVHPRVKRNCILIVIESEGTLLRLIDLQYYYNAAAHNDYRLQLLLIMYFQVLVDFPHTTPNIPISYLFDLIPPLQPRAFSIASSQKVSIVDLVSLL